ncbi:MAG: hypothetical protein AAFQ40_13985, partial [Cyanobacteria bacterium J06623_5]
KLLGPAGRFPVADAQLAVNWVYRDTGIQIERGVIAIALEDTPAQVFTLDADDLFFHWRNFQARLRRYYRQRLR